MAGNDENGASPATPKAAGGPFAALTPRETEILSKVMNCLKTPIEIDYDMLAGEVGLNVPRSASNAWATIKKKMGWNVKADTASTGKSTGGAKRKKAAADSDDADDDGDTAEGTPSKKVKTPSKPRKKAVATPKKTPASAKKFAVTPKKGKAVATPKSSAVANDSSSEEHGQEQISDDAKEDDQEEQVVKGKRATKSVKVEEADDAEANNDGEV